jgi:hypothetical protein
MIIKRILATIIITLISLPIWFELLRWIVVPKDYISDGGSDFAYGFTIFFILLPITGILTLIVTWIYSKKILLRLKKLFPKILTHPDLKSG